MQNKLLCTVFALFLILISCANKGKMETITIKIKDTIFTVEVARTADEQQRGLMFRNKLGNRNGMLFAYKEYTKGAFWMKNTRIPLSIAFISDTGKILDIKNMTPYSEQTVAPAYSYLYALELNKGAFQEIGAQTGDYIQFPEGFQ